jgi:hypothetical protein
METMFGLLSLKKHKQGTDNAYTVAIVDDTSEGRTKLVVMFGGEGNIAVLDLDRLIEQEDISEEKKSTRKLEDYVRALEKD